MKKIFKLLFSFNYIDSKNLIVGIIVLFIGITNLMIGILTNEHGSNNAIFGVVMIGIGIIIIWLKKHFL